MQHQDMSSLAQLGPRETRHGWPLAAKIVFAGFLIIAGYLVITEHRAHLIFLVPYLPFAIILACPLMHVFMHHGGSHDSGSMTGMTEKPQ